MRLAVMEHTHTAQSLAHEREHSNILLKLYSNPVCVRVFANTPFKCTIYLCVSLCLCVCVRHQTDSPLSRRFHCWAMPGQLAHCIFYCLCGEMHHISWAMRSALHSVWCNSSLHASIHTSLTHTIYESCVCVWLCMCYIHIYSSSTTIHASSRSRKVLRARKTMRCDCDAGLLQTPTPHDRATDHQANQNAVVAVDLRAI